MKQKPKRMPRWWLAKCRLGAKWPTWNFLNLWLFFEKTEASTFVDSKNKAGDHIVASKDQPKRIRSFFFESPNLLKSTVDFMEFYQTSSLGLVPPSSLFQDPSKVFQISQYPPPKLTSFKDETLQPKRSNKIEQNKKSSAACWCQKALQVLFWCGPILFARTKWRRFDRDVIVGFWLTTVTFEKLKRSRLHD